jgi:hypothetical protein
VSSETAAAVGSDPQDSPDWDRRLRELREWVKEYRSWQEWNERWRGRREPGWLGPRERRVKPDPPVWLADECRDVVADGGDLYEACELLRHWQDDPATAQIRQQTQTARTQAENPTKTKWWEHIHLDLFWPMTQLGSSVYGVAGMHATIDVTRRLQVFVAPGMMMLNLPALDGTREWKAATDWGFSYRLIDFKVMGSERMASLHLNFAKAWIFGGPQPGGGRSTVDLAGFSVTFMKVPVRPTQ